MNQPYVGRNLETFFFLNNNTCNFKMYYFCTNVLCELTKCILLIANK